MPEEELVDMVIDVTPELYARVEAAAKREGVSIKSGASKGLRRWSVTSPLVSEASSLSHPSGL